MRTVERKPESLRFGVESEVDIGGSVRFRGFWKMVDLVESLTRKKNMWKKKTVGDVKSQKITVGGCRTVGGVGASSTAGICMVIKVGVSLKRIFI